MSKFYRLYNFCLRTNTFLLFLFAHINGHSQSFVFKNYNAKNGLDQLQISALTQDSFGRLWLATEYGIGTFDGQKFSSYSVKEGLANNHCKSIAIGEHSTVWVGTMHGLSSFNGGKFNTYYFGKKAEDNIVTFVRKDNQNDIWCVAGNQLYSVRNNKVIRADLPIDLRFSELVTDNKGNLFALSIAGKLYRCNKNRQWSIQELPIKEFGENKLRYIRFDHKNRMWIVFGNALYRESDHGFEEMNFPQIEQYLSPRVFALNFDQGNNVWFSTLAGTFTIQKNKLYKIDKQNGFSNNLVFDFFLDREGLFWLATVEGDGLFRLDNLELKQFSPFEGINKEQINSFCIDSSATVWIGTKDKLFTWNEQIGLKEVRIPSKDLSPTRVVFLRTETDGSVWISTYPQGVWRFKDGKLSPLNSGAKSPIIDMVSYCLKDQNQRYWLASFRGLFRSENEQILPLKGFNNVTYCLLEVGKDSMMVGTVNGVLLIHNNKNILTNVSSLLQRSTITCMYKMNRTVWIGTDNGLFSYHLDQKRFQFHSGNSPFTFISNIAPFPNRNQLILGTSYGLALLDLSNNKISDINPSIGLHPLALGLYSMHVDKKRKLLWFGTEEGLFTYEYGLIKNPDPLSKVILTSVLCDGQVLKPNQWNQGVSNWFGIPQSLKLPSKNSRLSFEFKAVSLRDNEGVQYQYRILGLNDNWSSFSKNQKLEYAALGPGNYTIEVKAKSRDGQFAKQSVSYSFRVLPSFYETSWFRFLILLLTLIFGAGIQFMFTTIRKKSKDRMELALKTEREIVRKRTAEDFHDELGSKLIRIRLFSDALATKISTADPEAINLIKLIKENSTQLFQNARDIIWSLNPESDNLYEVLSRVCDFSVEMFQSTGTYFREIGVKELDRNIYLPLEYSRNITMTLKEMLTNSFKHAHASEVTLSIKPINDQEWLICIKDNGIGFDLNTIELGNGIKNMQSRIKRINGNLSLSSQVGQGSSLELTFRLPIN